MSEHLIKQLQEFVDGGLPHKTITASGLTVEQAQLAIDHGFTLIGDGDSFVSKAINGNRPELVFDWISSPA